ncbi:MAG: hypothetical protein N2645_22115 [Clostridia bacterium]|nr:hypothetical protein [Clostridia bacterium]
MHKKGFPIQLVQEFDEEVVKKLAELHITTCEEFIGVSNTESQRNLLMNYLKVNEHDFLCFLESAKKMVPADLVKKLAAPSDTSQFGLGAVIEDMEK